MRQHAGHLAAFQCGRRHRALGEGLEGGDHAFSTGTKSQRTFAAAGFHRLQRKLPLMDACSWRAGYRRLVIGTSATVRSGRPWPNRLDQFRPSRLRRPQAPAEASRHGLVRRPRMIGGMAQEPYHLSGPPTFGVNGIRWVTPNEQPDRRCCRSNCVAKWRYDCHLFWRRWSLTDSTDFCSIRGIVLAEDPEYRQAARPVSPRRSGVPRPTVLRLCEPRPRSSGVIIVDDRAVERTGSFPGRTGLRAACTNRQARK